jgi:hypothetical protein
MSALLFLSDSFRHPVQFPAGALDLALRLLLLRGVHLRQSFGEPAAGAAKNGKRHLQIALDLFGRGGFRCLRLPLRFQKQLRFAENALANYPRALAPGGVKLRRLPGIAAVLHQYVCHALTVFGADASYRHQILHGDLRSDVSFAHMPLNRFGQQLDQGQPPRYPTDAPVETARQFVERVAEALFHLRQQPALFERAFLRAHSLRTR